MTFNRHQPDPGLAAATRELGACARDRVSCPVCRAGLLRFEAQPVTGYLVEFCGDPGCGYRSVIVPRPATERDVLPTRKYLRDPSGPQCGSRTRYDAGCRCPQCRAGHNSRENARERKAAERAG